MGEYIGAGQLDKHAEVLDLRETEPGVWTWEKAGMAWANITFQSKNNLFSSVGIGARNAAVTVRRRPLTLHNALRWNGQHLFLTSVVSRGRNYLDVNTALVTPVVCSSDGVTFPAVQTEKYLGHVQEWPMSAVDMTMVLVTPKPIVLCPGHLVYLEKKPWEILVSHELDEWKNEYEIGRRAEA